MKVRWSGRKVMFSFAVSGRRPPAGLQNVEILPVNAVVSPTIN